MNESNQEIVNIANLRTLFDYPSTEWSQTTMQEKVKLLEKLVSDNNLLNMVLEMKQFLISKGHSNVDVGNSLIMGLVELLNYSLKEHKK